MRRALAAAGAGSLIAAAAAAPAQGATLSQTYSCLYPLISSQPLSVDIDAAIPEETTVGEPTGEFNITANATTNDTTWDGLNLVQAKTIEGTAVATSNIDAPGFSLPLQVPVTIPVSDVPATRQPLNITANGKTPSLVFPQEGTATITVEAMRMNLRAKKADGTSVVFPPVPGVPDSDGDPETFDVVCTLSPADQNKKLTDILIKAPVVENEAPTAPGMPMLTSIDDITPTTAKITWDASTDADGTIAKYLVKYEDQVIEVPGDQTTTELVGLLPDSEYFITVTAVDDDGAESDPSEEGTIITPPSGDEVPTAPTNVTGTATTTTVELSWDASTDDGEVVGYEVWQNGTKVAEPTGTSATITGLTPGTDYTFQVLAKDDAGQTSVFSDPFEITTEEAADTPPSKPGNLQGTPTQTSVALSWSASTDDQGVTGYDVYRDGAKIATVTGTSANVTGLAPDTDYTFKVQAVDTKPQTGEFSDEITVKTLPQDDSVVDYSYDLAGRSQLKTLTRGSVPLSGGFDAKLKLATGEFTGDLNLDPTKARLKVLGLLPVSADIAFVNTAPTVGKLENGSVTATAKFKVRLPKLYLFGSIPLSNSSTCQTRSASVADLASQGEFNPLTGGRLTGTYALSSLTGCGAFTALISPLTAGKGNTIDVTLSSAAPQAS